LVVHIAYTGTSGRYVIYKTLSPFLRGRGWRMRLVGHYIETVGKNDREERSPGGCIRNKNLYFLEEW
jgi:hypothetical protein